MRIVLGVEYDGTFYCGWQSQPSACGVQDILEKAISKIAGHSIRVHAAGRTDAGVHALMQVVHFDTATIRPENAWVRGVNTFLPKTVRVVWTKLVTDDFHARFCAQIRRYQYLLVNHPVAPALLASKAGWYHLPLQLELMQSAAQYLIGEHDFSAKQNRQLEPCTRQVFNSISVALFLSFPPMLFYSIKCVICWVRLFT